MKERAYLAIDLKSFYASVECIQRGLDPMQTCLVVADPTRTEKTICLAVTPALKAFGIPGRARLFEVVQKVEQVNALRKATAPSHRFTDASWDAQALQDDPSLFLDYIVAPPQMALYMQTSAAIYDVYLEYVAPEDIHVYSIDEVFIDATPYLHTYGLTAEAFARKLIGTVFSRYGITATAGIGTNLYLAKVALDILAKHAQPDENGARIAFLDESRYRETLWNHLPLTDFWRVGHGTVRRLQKVGIHTMGDIARCSIGREGEFHNEDLLYKLFGVGAELLIDHAWGWEPCTIAQIKAYRPSTNSLSSGQVLTCPYTADKARLVVREMTDLLSLDLVDKGLVTDQLVLTLGYDIENLTDPAIAKHYRGEITTDHYGRKVPKHAHGTGNLPQPTASSKALLDCVTELYDRIADPRLLIRRVTIAACHVTAEASRQQADLPMQLDLFAEPPDTAALEKEKRRQQAVLSIRKKYGKNAILKGMNFEEGATAKERNAQIGGHKA